MVDHHPIQSRSPLIGNWDSLARAIKALACHSSHACPGARARRLIVSSEGWSWINSTLLPGATLACTALIASSGSLVATIQSSNVRPPVDADRTASTRTKNASAMLSIWHGPWTAANSRSRSRWSHLRPNAAEKGRMAWQKATGYGRRSLAETALGVTRRLLDR